MADLIDNAKEKTGLLEKFLESTKKIDNALKEPESQEQIDVLAAEITNRDSIISEINIINKLIENANFNNDEQKSELESQSQLWFALLKEIQELEQRNEAKIESLSNMYMGKVKSAKDSIRVIDAYSRQMTDEAAIDPVSIDKKN